MAAKPTSARGVSEVTSATASPMPASAEARVEAVATVHLGAVPRVTAGTLAGESTSGYDAKARFQRAKDLAGKRDKENARRIFQEIIDNLRSDPSVKSLLMTARCQIETALTYTTRSDEKTYLFSQAKANCDQLFQARASWQEEEKSTNYSHLIKNYDDLLILCPTGDPAREDIRPNLQTCRQESKSLTTSAVLPGSPAAAPAVAPLPSPSFGAPPLLPLQPAPSTAAEPPPPDTKQGPFDVEASYAAARSVLEAGNYEKAHIQFSKILINLGKVESIEDFLILANSHLGIARVYDRESLRNDNTNLARKAYSVRSAVQACDTIYQLLASPKALDPRQKISYYEGLKELYSFLVNMVPKDQQTRIQDLLDFCKEQAGSLKASAPSSGAAPAAAGAPSRLVSGAAPSSPPPQPPAQQPQSPPVPPLDTAALNNPASHARQYADPQTFPRQAAAGRPGSPKKVTPGPVGISSRISFIFGLSIAAILAAIAGVVIYNRRWYVKK